VRQDRRPSNHDPSSHGQQPAEAGRIAFEAEEVPADNSHLLAAVGSRLVEDSRRHMIAEGIEGRPAGNILDSTWRLYVVCIGSAQELRTDCCTMAAWPRCCKQMDENNEKRRGSCPGDTETGACSKAWVLRMPRFRWLASVLKTGEA